MVDSYTSNRDLIQPQVGSDSGTWGGLLNSGVMAQLDLILGATQAITITSGDVTLSIPQWNNCAVKLTGALTGDHNLILPFNVNSGSVAVGGLFVVDNQTTGAHNVTVLTAAAGSTGVTVPQGVRTFLYSDTTNVWYADDAKLQLIPYSGNPNGFVAGAKGSVNNPPTMVWDYTNAVLYACTTTGPAATAAWTNIVASGAPLPALQGYLTPVSGQPIITADSIAATSIYYTPFIGAWTAVHNGLSIISYQFSQFQLTLSASQAASNIYDVFLAYNGGAPVIGTGPSWAANGGSVTAGSCSRGTGAGSTAINRNAASGLWVNTNAISLIYNTGSGNNTISVPAGQAVLLGSIFIDSIAGQVTCHRAYGQSRKWGISNAYNRVPVYLKAGDGTPGWTYTTNAYRPANNNTANSLTVFDGLAEEVYSFQLLSTASSNVAAAAFSNGIGIDSTSAVSGYTGNVEASDNNGRKFSFTAQCNTAPSLGINVITILENTINNASGTQTYYGTEASLLLTAVWRA